MKRRHTSRAETGVVFRDFLFIMLLVMLMLINPPTKTDAITQPPGNMIVSISWPDGPTDVDLWVRGPGETRAVGYSNRGGPLFNLLRDDLGTANDSLSANYENAYSRGLPAGRYVINVHCFTCAGPVRVSVEVRMTDGSGTPTLLFGGVIVLPPKAERTVVQFRLDGERNISGVNNVFEQLREAK